MNKPHGLDNTVWRPVLRPVGHLLIAAQLALVLQPLSVLAQDKGQAPFNPQAQTQLQRLGQLNQSIEQAKARKAREQQSPADRVSDQLARAHELTAQLASSLPMATATAPNAQRRALPGLLPAQRAQRQGELSAVLAEVVAGTASVQAEFDATRAELQRKGLPAQILARHDEAKAQIDQRANQLTQIAARTVSDDDKVRELDAFFKQYPARKRHTPMDPGQLPWGAPKATPRMPAETKTAWYQQLTRDHKVQLAQAGGLTTIGGIQFTHPPEPTQAPQDADLAETPDVQLTPAIRAQAQQLGYNPVAIENWVRNNIQWLPTWGSIQGADGTLKTLRGNAFDTASLTIALLRASGIPARYQFGTIELPADAAMNWVGGVQKPEAALNLMYQGGIAARGLVSAGRIAAIRMEHVWVRAYTNFTPSRGGMQGGAAHRPPVLAAHGQPQHPSPNAQLNLWAPLDGAFKQYDYTPGLDLKTAVPVDANALLAAVQQGAMVTPHYVQNLNQANLQAQLTGYQNQLTVYIDSSPKGASATVGDVLGTQTIRKRTFGMLTGSLPYVQVVTGNQMAELPQSLRWKASFALYTSDTDRANDSPAFRVERPLAALNGQRLALTYEPSSSADQQVLDAARANEQTSFAAYAVRMNPKLKLEDAELATGPASLVGQEHYLRVTFTSPWEVLPREYRIAAGDVSAIVINSSGMTAAQFNSRTQQYDLRQNPNLSNYVLEMLHQIGLGWWAEKYAFEDVLGTQMGVLKYNLPSHARVGASFQARYFLGIARSASYRGRVMDAKLDYMTVEPKSGAVAALERLNFMRAAGQTGSFLEGAIFDQAFLSEQPRGVSTVSLLASANQQGIPIYVLTQDNAGEIANLTVSSDVKQEIADAVSMGRQVIVSRDEVDHYGYRGVGYIIEDVEIGSAAYQIDGGLSGGGSDGPQSVLPFPSMTFTPIIGILLAPTLKQLGARLMVDSAGQMIGVGFFQQYAAAIPAPAPSPDVRVAALIAALLAILSAMKLAMDTQYPKRVPLALVKYSNPAVAQLNYSTKMIRASAGGTFGGNVVYLALFNDPVVRAMIGGIPGCPPVNLAQRAALANAYQLSDSGSPPFDPDRASASVYFEITREGVYSEKFNFNSNGVTEVTISEDRLIPKFVFGDDLARLYIGDWAPAIENAQLCK